MATSALESHHAQCFKDKDIIIPGVLTLNTIQIHHSLIKEVDITYFMCLQNPKKVGQF